MYCVPTPEEAICALFTVLCLPDHTCEVHPVCTRLLIRMYIWGYTGGKDGDAMITFDWDDANTEHVLAHGVTPEEAEEA